MDLKKYSISDISKIKIIQRNLRSRLEKIKNINDRMNRLYNIIYGIMKRIHNNFILGIIDQFEYNSNMSILDTQLLNFKKIPRPFKLKDLVNFTVDHIIDNLIESLLDIVKSTGTECIFDIIYLCYKKSNKDLLEEFDKESKNLIYFYNNVFIPLEIDIYDNSKIKISNKKSIVPLNNKMNKKNYDMRNILISKKIKSIKCVEMFKKKKSFMEKIQGARLYIPLRNKKQNLCIDGYFIEDPLNISRVGGLFEKKEEDLKKKIDFLNINNHFKYAFITQISIRDFIIYENETLISKCLEAFNELDKLKKKTISSLVKEFLVADITKQRDVLTLFLLMKDDVDTQYLAYLMYDMITNESYLLKPQPLAEQVFNSLHWSVQKLFKVAIKKINKITDKLLNFTEEEISYEKRIMLMKTDDYIKSKALEKLKEYIKSNEGSSKCLQYIDGILKIPFNIYKKERILCFLDEYKDNLKLFIKTFLFEIKKLNKMDNLDCSINDNKLLCEKYFIINDDNEYHINMKSSDIDLFINKFNYNMFTIFSDIFNIEEDNLNIMKYCKNLKKKKLVEVIKLINDDINKKKDNHKIIDLTLKKKELLDKIGEFISDESYLDIVQKYINFFDKDRLNKISCNSDSTLQNLNNMFFDLNTKWFNYKNDYKNYLEKTNNILDEAVYNQQEAKIQIKRIIAQWINGKMKGYCFGFEGPPGTGKTSLAKKGISKCLVDDNGNTRPFAFIALGGSSNGSTLVGHSYTYVGSTWGRIVDILMESKCMNPIIYIDELDKISNTENGKELIGILTHLTDLSQNDEFCDKYFSGVKLDLSQVLFIFSYNDFSLLDPILADRIHRVKFNKLNKYEKITIVNNYILPELLETVGFNNGDINFPKKVLEYIITTYTLEAGVRKLKEKIFEIVRELNLRYLMSNDLTFPFSVDIKLVDEIFHNNHKITIKKIAPVSRIGLVNGLYATASGIGGLTIIESFKTPSESKLLLELTGQQGDVMKESMKVAKTVAWNLIPLEIKNKIYKDMEENGNFGIHLHCPEGATPKDGPSAGAAITLAIVSLLCGIKVTNMVALTGEIDLNGSIHEIGGLESKIEGGKSAGVKKVLYPSKNQKDVDLIKEKGNILNNIEVQSIENIWEVLDICLEKNNLSFNKYIE